MNLTLFPTIIRPMLLATVCVMLVGCMNLKSIRTSHGSSVNPEDGKTYTYWTETHFFDCGDWNFQVIYDPATGKNTTNKWFSSCFQ
jgi:hypothetical protein